MEKQKPEVTDLRDYFAGQALAGITSNQDFLDGLDAIADISNVVLVDLVAGTAYGMADAMMKAREKQ